MPNGSRRTPLPRTGGRRLAAPALVLAALLVVSAPAARAQASSGDERDSRRARAAELAAAMRDSLARAEAAAPRTTAAASDAAWLDSLSVDRARLDSLVHAALPGDSRAADSAADSLAATREPGPYIELSAPAVPARPRFASRTDSLSWVRARDRAERASGLRVVVSLLDRRLWVVRGDDTLHTAPVAVATGDTLRWKDREWYFHTPRGVRVVHRKQENPVWIPPEWHYVEAARAHGLKLRHLRVGQPVKLDSGAVLTVRDGYVGVAGPDGVFQRLPAEDEIIFGDTLFVPPLGTKNRRIEGELGKYRLDLGDGYLLHGTPHTESIGQAATHGCIRLGDDDIEWLYDNVPVGARVYIY